MPGQFYARYVPPKAHKETALQEPETQQSHVDEVVAPRKEKDPKRPKKRKRVEQQDAAAEDEATSRKHKAVLSKFEKSSQLASVVAAREKPKDEAPEEEPELHDLGPLPQPEPVPDVPYKPEFSALPSWLAQPITAPMSSRKPFEQLRIDPKLIKHLKSKGYHEAFAVQSAVLPLLLPGGPPDVADVCVSAATGSGKTLAYLLPMIESMRHRVVTQLRGVIVVPTRELVFQAREVAELCAVGSGLKIGTAMGSHAFGVEQDMLIKKGRRYDSATSVLLRDKAKQRLADGWAADEDNCEDVLDVLPGHVPEYESKVDILICTPGRLVEHLHQTKGFNLNHVDWLVIDEADRLLDQSFQDWADTVMTSLEAEKTLDQMSPRDRIKTHLRYLPQKRNVRKVILSATMTRDLSKLDALRLRRPKLVIVEGTEHAGGRIDGDVFELPNSLYECAIPVGDGSRKPLFLLRLLQTQILPDLPKSAAPSYGEQMDEDTKSEDDSDDSESVSSTDTESTDEESDDDSAPSDSESSVSAESSAASDSTSTDTDSESDAQSSSSDTLGGDESTAPTRSTTTTTTTTTTTPPASNVLIFTHNNENANRLSRLLGLLNPAYGPLTGTLTKSSTSSSSRKLLRAFNAGKLRILIASDRASRGLDLANLTHLVNYDMATSVTSYVHRVGRTARAGNAGTAWTLFTRSEAGWFWNVVARGEAVVRAAGLKVQRLKLEDAVSEEALGGYEEALARLRDEVRGNGE
ncbi:P-loop containing nucleoside triphosphate hydrolase protein [Phyllosticta citriasiana]|uniref:P-loop containing nucleoside triphosphate hydrolase protein n=1 Tax=Phyllosticta citriasiana TaxID=595635 RepID=UPI0030FDC478